MTTRRERLGRYQDARRRADPRQSLEAFEALVARALDALPPYVHERLENVAVVVEEWPDPARVAAMGYDPEQHLLGLYEGVPRQHRGTGYHLVVPDRISLYRQPILDQAAGRGRAAIVDEIRTTILHEVAHHFGMDDDEIEALEGRRRVRPGDRA